jgi:hypothetical protein
VLRIGDYESAPDASAASWIIAGLRGFAESVLSFVPAGFERYGRVFHPAWRHEPDTPVLWREVAQANGRLAHRAMQWRSITGEYLDGYWRGGQLAAGSARSGPCGDGRTRPTTTTRRGRGLEDDHGLCSSCCPVNPGRTEVIAGSGFDLGVYGCAARDSNPEPAD